MQDSTEPNFKGGELLAGKYRVERVIGQGGMGVVLAARHEALNTNVAIKLLREIALEHTDVVGRFMREARAAVSLRSEHVARVFDVGELDDGRPYIVMERLEGKDLGDIIEAGPMLPVPTAVDYVMQACEAIAEAHRAGIIHRDLKPKNLFLTHAVHGKPLVKVLDFGISKVAGPNDMQLTKTTEVIGSPSYMSPEQLRSSRAVDARTDIWALGVILYELLTRRVPFYAETVTELVLVVVTEREPPVSTYRQDIPPELEAVISRCLQKHPDQRFQNVVDLVQALEPFAGQGVQATFTERVRAVAGEPHTRPLTNPPAHSPMPPPAYPPHPASSGSALAPAPVASSRVNVHGGTSVAWGETQSQPSPIANGYVTGPIPGTTGRGGLIAALSLAAFVAIGAVGGALWYVKRANATAMIPSSPQAAAAGESAMPLPPGRKDLPPIPAPPPLPASAEPPAASVLPDVRKPPSTPTAAKPAQVARPAGPQKPTAPPDKGGGGDDLSNIGRR